MDLDNKKELTCPYAAVHPSTPSPTVVISLFDIWNVLYRHRLIVGVTTIIGVCVAIALIFFTPKQYVSKVVIAPGNSFEMPLINALIGKQVGFQIPPMEDIFPIACNNLTNINVKSQFWDEKNQGGKLVEGRAFGGPDKISQKWFIQNLACQVPKGKNNKVTQATVVLTGRNPEINAEVLSEFVSYVDEFSANTIIVDFKNQLEIQKEVIKSDIARQENIVQQNKLLRIAYINDAIEIAEKLGIYDLPENVTESPLFARGVKALQIEKEMLLKRTGDGEYDKNLLTLKTQLENLNKINIDDIKISTLQIGKVFSEPKRNQNPLFLIAAGIIFGLMLGIFLVFVQNIRQGQKKVFSLDSNSNAQSS